MHCQEAEIYVSVMHDGEAVPLEFRNHFEDCGACQERLKNYLELGSALRRMASRSALTEAAHRFNYPETRPARSSWAFLTGKITVPRFAMLLLACAFLTASAGLVAVHAQNPARPLWFQFELSSSASQDARNPRGRQDVAQAGYDEVSMKSSPAAGIVAMHVAVFGIKQDSVDLAIRARRVTAEVAETFKIRETLGDLTSHRYMYTPGQKLSIPVEGGGTLELQGRIVDHQPELAFGFPLRPRQLDELVVSNPVLISGKTVEANMAGATARTKLGDPYPLVRLYSPDAGLFVFSLSPFSGAVEGRAEWGKLDFNVDGQSYSLLCALPLTGGGQPRSVWVKRISDYKPDDQRSAMGFLGTWNPALP